MIVMGVDAHSQTHTAAAVNGVTGEQLGTREERARQLGHEQLLAWGRALRSGDEGGRSQNKFSKWGDMKRPLRLARLFRPLSSVERSGIDVSP